MRKSRRKPFIAIDAGVILLAILFFVLTGDGLGEGKEGSTNSVIEKKKVVFLTKSMDSSFWQSAYAGAGAASAEYIWIWCAKDRMETVRKIMRRRMK